MSEDNKNPLAGAAGIVENIKALKETNPKALYGTGAVVVLGILFVMLSGGDGGSKAKTAMIVPGQAVTLENPNGGQSLIDQSPGMFSSREESDTFVCHVPKGTQAKVLEQTMVNGLPFIRVEVTGGDCAGKSGFTAMTNVKN